MSAASLIPEVFSARHNESAAVSQVSIHLKLRLAQPSGSTKSHLLRTQNAESRKQAFAYTICSAYLVSSKPWWHSMHTEFALLEGLLERFMWHLALVGQALRNINQRKEVELD